MRWTHTVGLIMLIVILGGLVLAWPLKRINEKVGQTLSYVAHLGARIAVVVIGGGAGIVALSRGSWWIALGVLLIVIAFGAVVMSAIFVIASVQTIRGGRARVP